MFSLSHEPDSTLPLSVEIASLIAGYVFLAAVFFGQML